MSELETEIVAEREYKKIAVVRKVHTWTEGFIKGFEMRDPEVRALKRHIEALERIIKIAYEGR